MKNQKVLTRSQVFQKALILHKSYHTMGVEGDPGIGKTTLFHDFGKEVNKPVFEVHGSSTDYLEMGGLAVVMPDGSVARMPVLEAFKKAKEIPSIIFFDEATEIPAANRSAMKKVVLEHRVGDIKFHPETWVVMAWNPPEQCPNAMPIDEASLISRINFTYMTLTLDEWVEWLVKQGDRPHIQIACQDLAFIIKFKPELFQPAAPTEPGPWPSPRALYEMIVNYANAVQLGAERAVINDILDGKIGMPARIAFMAIKDMLAEFPSEDEVLKNPDSARLPADQSKQISMLSLLLRVAHKDNWAAWEYSKRVGNNEIKMAVQSYLFRVPETKKSPWRSSGERERVLFSNSMRKVRAE